MQSVGVFVGGYGIPAIPTLPSEVLPQISQNSQKLLAEDFLPQISQMLTEISGVKEPPTEFTEFTEISGVEEPPTDFTDAHRWLGCVGFCGKIV